MFLVHFGLFMRSLAFFPPPAASSSNRGFFFSKERRCQGKKMNKKLSDASQCNQQQSENQCKSKDERKTTDVPFERSTKMHTTEAHSMHFKKMHIFCMCLEKESRRLTNGNILKSIKKEPSSLMCITIFFLLFSI